MTANAGTAPSRAARLRSIVGGSAGNLVEWYDWYVYSAFALYFAPVIFPKGSPTAQLLDAAAIFAVGFVMRPVGAWVMGVYSDHRGRKAGLTLSVVLMCVGSLLVAVTPTYAAAGWGAPALLVAARMLQGLSVGGEYGASAVYLSEMAERGRRGFYASFQYVTLIGGQLTALGVQLVLQGFLTEAQLEAWGWRVPFVIGGGLAILVFRIRRGLLETESFRNAAAGGTPRSSGLALFRDHPREAWTVVAMTAGGTLAFYAYTTYMQKFLVNTTGFDRRTATWVMTAALAFYALFQPVAGALSDRVGRRPLLLGFGVVGILGTVPLFVVLESARSPVVALLLIGAALATLSGYTAISGLVKAEMFPAHIRTAGGGAALCAGEHGLRGDGGISGAVAEEGRGGARLLLVRDRDDRGVVRGVLAAAGYPRCEPDRGGVGDLPYVTPGLSRGPGLRALRSWLWMPGRARHDGGGRALSLSRHPGLVPGSSVPQT